MLGFNIPLISLERGSRGTWRTTTGSRDPTVQTKRSFIKGMAYYTLGIDVYCRDLDGNWQQIDNPSIYTYPLALPQACVRPLGDEQAVMGGESG